MVNITKTVCHEARKVVLVAFYENDNTIRPTVPERRGAITNNSKVGPFFAIPFFMQKDLFPPDPTNANKAATHSTACGCPHWAPTSKACLLVKDGLFLPVQEHISAYCTSQYYLSCQQYQLLANLHDQAHQDDQLPINRRRSIRVPRYHLFRFSEINPMHQSPENRLEETWTIDVSEHGIRFASYRHLVPDTLIRFSLEDAQNLGIANGQARVIWSEPLENTPLFHAGIAFSE